MPDAILRISKTGLGLLRFCVLGIILGFILTIGMQPYKFVISRFIDSLSYLVPREIYSSRVVTQLLMDLDFDHLCQTKM